MARFQYRIVVVARLCAVLIGFAASAALVWHSSSAAFVASTDNPASNWSTGSVALSDDDAGSAMFTAANLKPGSTGERCLAVTYGGDVAVTVKLFAGSSSATNELDDWVDLTVQQGTTGSFAGDCVGFVQDAGAANAFTGTLETFAGTFTDSATGFGTWAPTASGQIRVYKIVYTIAAAAPNTVQGSNAQIDFTWQATS